MHSLSLSLPHDVLSHILYSGYLSTFDALTCLSLSSSLSSLGRRTMHTLDLHSLATVPRLEGFKALKCLDLSRSPWDGKGYASYLSTVQDLNLKGCAVGDAEAAALAGLPSLTRLDISKTSASASTLLTSLAAFEGRTLRSLNVSWNVNLSRLGCKVTDAVDVSLTGVPFVDVRDCEAVVGNGEWADLRGGGR